MEKQFVAMYYLHKIIKERWIKIFHYYTDIDFSIDRRMRGHNDYLAVKYKQIKPDIIKKKKSGSLFVDCSICGYEALYLTSIDKNDYAELFQGNCLICTIKDTLCLCFTCADCEEYIFAYEGDCQCTNCQKRYKASEIAEIVDDRSLYEVKDGGELISAHCSECDGFETVRPIDGFYVCLQCLACFNEEELFQCEYCSSYNTIEFEMSYLSGCTACDGKFGSDSFMRE